MRRTRQSRDDGEFPSPGGARPQLRQGRHIARLLGRRRIGTGVPALRGPRSEGSPPPFRDAGGGGGGAAHVQGSEDDEAAAAGDRQGVVLRRFDGEGGDHGGEREEGSDVPVEVEDDPGALVVVVVVVVFVAAVVVVRTGISSSVLPRTDIVDVAIAGWDRPRHGIRGGFRLPVQPREIVRGERIQGGSRHAGDVRRIPPRPPGAHAPRRARGGGELRRIERERRQQVGDVDPPEEKSDNIARAPEDREEEGRPGSIRGGFGARTVVDPARDRDRRGAGYDRRVRGGVRRPGLGIRRRHVRGGSMRPQGGALGRGEQGFARAGVTKKWCR